MKEVKDIYHENFKTLKKEIEETPEAGEPTGAHELLRLKL